MDVDFDELEHHELIHIHKVSTRGRKCETRVIGIPECFDYKKILKFWKNNFQTNGRLCRYGQYSKEKEKEKYKDKKKGDKDKVEEEYVKNEREDIIVNGDHRKKIKEFLVYMGISDEENIRVHGAA